MSKITIEIDFPIEIDESNAMIISSVIDKYLVEKLLRHGLMHKKIDIKMYGDDLYSCVNYNSSTLIGGMMRND